MGEIKEVSNALDGGLWCSKVIFEDFFVLKECTKCLKMILIDVVFRIRRIILLNVFIYFINELKRHLWIWWKVSMIITVTCFQMFKLVDFFICSWSNLFCKVPQHQRINSRYFLLILDDFRQKVSGLIGKISKRRRKINLILNWNIVHFIYLNNLIG